MEKLLIDPSRKLTTKFILILSSISVYLILFALIFQIFLPFDPKITFSDVAIILWPITFGVIVLLWIIIVPLINIWVKNLHFEIGSERITIHKGIITKIEQNIPYRAVTDFMLHRSLFDRVLGMASIRIQTAGQAPTATGYEGVLGGLINYESLMTEVRARLKRYNEIHDNGSSDSDKHADKNAIQIEILEELKMIRKALEKN